MCVWRLWSWPWLLGGLWWLWVRLGSSLDPRVYWNNKRAVSAEERGVTQGASSEADLPLLFFPQLKHTQSPDHPHTPPRLTDMKTTRLSPFPQLIFHLLEASDTSKQAWLHICAIMWSNDGKSVPPPGTLMRLLSCYYVVIKSKNTIWRWRHFHTWRLKVAKSKS